MISPGSPYGVITETPSGVVEVNTDADAANVVREARRHGASPPALLLRGGDLHRTLGGIASSGDSARIGRTSVMFPVDLGVVEVDGTEHIFVAHAVLRRQMWSGPFLVAMNAQWCGPLDLGPRSHPGDGLLDITSGALGARQRLEARRRARSGTHLPHPDLVVRRSHQEVFESERPFTLYLDGQPVQRCQRVLLRVESDALTVHI